AWDHPKQADSARQQLKQLQDERVARLQDEAKELQKSLTDITSSGDNDPTKQERILSTVKAITQVAHSYVTLNHLSLAEELVQSTLEKLDDTAGPYDESLGITFLTLAQLFNMEGEDSRAGPFFQQAADIFQRSKMKQSDAADFSMALANWFYQRKQLDKAQDYANRALYLRRGPDNTQERGDIYLLCAKIQGARKDRRRGPLVQQFEKLAFSTYRTVGSADGIAECRLIQASRMDALENTKEADQLTIDALRAAEASENVSMPMLVTALRTLGDRYVNQKQFEKAEPLLKRAVAHLELEPDKNSRQMADTLTTLAQLYSLTGRSELAESLRYQIDMLQTKIP
ncbi:MAG: tetratricopeptide repeat protein, partial [Terriglobales bacterium]